MNILYVNGHPRAESFHTAIQRAYTRSIKAEHNVVVLELGTEHFDPVLRFGYAARMPEDPFITKSQELILWADHIVFAFPLWWGDAPALMKGWVERVFTPGVTYTFDRLTLHKLLKGKTADLIVTSRGVRWLYWPYGDHGVGIFKRNLFALCGLKCRSALVLGGIGLHPRLDTAKRREAFLAKVARHAARL